jgi:hypothetical protein
VATEPTPPEPSSAPVDEDQSAREPSSSATSTERARSTPRTKPVRVTVELQPVEHRGLRRLCERYADDLEVPTVAGAEVLRVLLELAQGDEQLARRVGEELGRTGGSRRRWA